MSKDQPIQTVGETLEASANDIVREFEDCINNNADKYKSPFYIFVLTKKEYLLINTIRNYFIARQTAPYAMDMMVQYPHHTKTLYLVDAKKGKVKLCWTLPGYLDCKSISKYPQMYSEDLVNWIKQCFEGKLNREKYSFDD